MQERLEEQVLSSVDHCFAQPSDSAQGSGTVLLLGTPPSLRVGLDYCLWTTGPKFMGIRGIPAGPHFLFWEPPDENSLGVLGCFFYLQPDEVVVRRWSAEIDVFEQLDVDEAERYILGVRRGDFFLNLGPYPDQFIPRWKELSCYVTKDVVERIEPVRKFITARTKEYDEQDSQIKKSFEERLAQAFQNDVCLADDSDSDTEMKEDVKPVHGDDDSELLSCQAESVIGDAMGKQEKVDTVEEVTEKIAIAENDATRYLDANTLFFSDIPTRQIPPNSSGAATTRLAVDRSLALQKLIEQQLQGDWKQLLGEVQMAYVCFLLGQNYQAFEQWKQLVSLICDCDDAVKKYPRFYAGFLRVLHGQLLQAPDDFFQDILMANNFLVQCLGNISESCGDQKAPEQLRRRVSYLKDLVSRKFHMSLEELLALDENAPVVVDVNASLVSFDIAASNELADS